MLYVSDKLPGMPKFGFSFTSARSESPPVGSSLSPHFEWEKLLHAGAAQGSSTMKVEPAGLQRAAPVVARTSA